MRNGRTHRRTEEEFVGEEVKDESERNENEEGQEYLFFDIESCQDEGYYCIRACFSLIILVT